MKLNTKEKTEKKLKYIQINFVAIQVHVCVQSKLGLLSLRHTNSAKIELLKTLVHANKIMITPRLYGAPAHGDINVDKSTLS